MEANSSLKTWTPPTNTALEFTRVWKPVTSPIELPAHRPSPPLSDASTKTSLAPSSFVSAAKLSGGAFTIGTRYGLLFIACGTPENQIVEFAETMPEEGAETGTGTSVCGCAREGKCETRGVCGGGRTRENSAASDVKGVWEGDNANRMFTFCDSNVTRF